MIEAKVKFSLVSSKPSYVLLRLHVAWVFDCDDSPGQNHPPEGLLAWARPAADNL